MQGINKFDKMMVKLTERVGFKIALFSIAATTILGNAVITPALPGMNAYFKANISDHASFAYIYLDVLVRLVLTIPAVFVMLLSPLAGWLMDRYGKLKFLYPALGLWAGAGVLGYFLNNIWAILLSRALLGVAMAFLMIGASALLADYYSCGGVSRRANALSWQGFFCAIGGSLFIYGGGFLSMVSWRAPFLIYTSGVFILLGAIIYLFEPRHKKEEVKQLEKVSFTPYLGIYFAGFFSMLLFFIVPTQLPYFMEDELGYLPKYVGICIGTMAFLEGVFSITYKRLCSFIGIKGVYVLSFFGMGLGFLGLCYFHTLVQIGTCLIFIGATLAYMLINNSEYLFKIAPIKARARVFGMLACCVFSSQFISPLLSQPLLKASSFHYLFMISACLLFVAGGLYLFFFKERKL